MKDNPFTALAHTKAFSVYTKEMQQVNKYIDEFIGNGYTPEMATVIESVKSTSGKQIRPRILLLAARYGAGYPQCSDRVCRFGAIIELVHMASLIHDDIVDDSPLRRGSPTIQGRFGKDVAVYAGDYLLAQVLYQLLSHDYRESGIKMATTMQSVCHGEIGQFAARFHTDTSIETYLDNIQGKTMVMFETACYVGAHESGCAPENEYILSELGKHIGFMFQLRDDVKDFISSEEDEGKPVHADFKNGVYTLPILYTFAQPGGEELRQIADKAVVGQLDAAELTRMEQMVRAMGGIEYAQGLILDHAGQARQLIAQLPHNEFTQSFAEMVDFLCK